MTFTKFILLWTVLQINGLTWALPWRLNMTNSISLNVITLTMVLLTVYVKCWPTGYKPRPLVLGLTFAMVSEVILFNSLFWLTRLKRNIATEVYIYTYNLSKLLKLAWVLTFSSQNILNYSQWEEENKGSLLPHPLSKVLSYIICTYCTVTFTV